MEEEKKVKTAKAEDKKEPAKKAPAKKAEPAEAKKPSAAALKAALAQMEGKETGKKPAIREKKGVFAPKIPDHFRKRADCAGAGQNPADRCGMNPAAGAGAGFGVSFHG